MRKGGRERKNMYNNIIEKQRVKTHTRLCRPHCKCYKFSLTCKEQGRVENIPFADPVIHVGTIPFKRVIII